MVAYGSASGCSVQRAAWHTLFCARMRLGFRNAFLLVASNWQRRLACGRLAQGGLRALLVWVMLRNLLGFGSDCGMSDLKVVVGRACFALDEFE